MTLLTLYVINYYNPNNKNKNATMLTVRYWFIPETKPHHITIFSRLTDLSQTYEIYNWDSVCSYTLHLHVTTSCLRVGVSTYTVQTTVCVRTQLRDKSFNRLNYSKSGRQRQPKLIFCRYLSTQAFSVVVWATFCCASNTTSSWVCAKKVRIHRKFAIKHVFSVHLHT